MTSNPLVSLTLVVKNGMPFLKDAIESAINQTYKNLEVVVQDGGSTDGSLDFLESIKDIKISIKSEKDSGTAQGWNRAIKRCRGGIIGSIDSDNILKNDALARIVKLFKKYPNAAAFYGANRLFSDKKELSKKESSFGKDRPFNLIRLMRCDLVPPFDSAFFSPKICKDKLRINEDMKTSGDYDLWLRLSSLKIISTKIIFAYTRIHKDSYSSNAKNYKQFCRDKINALENFLSRYNQADPVIKSLKDYCIAGIYAWATSAVYTLEGQSSRYKKLFTKSKSLDHYSERLGKLELQKKKAKPYQQFSKIINQLTSPFNN